DQAPLQRGTTRPACLNDAGQRGRLQRRASTRPRADRRMRQQRAARLLVVRTPVCNRLHPRLARGRLPRRGVGVVADRLRWGILSTARIARTLFVPGVRASTDTEVLAVGSRSLDAARAFADDLKIPRAYGSYAALLEDPDVDAVYVALPNGLHAEWTLRAAEARKHVLCEKPLARNAADAERMAEACNSAGVLLMEAFMWRHQPQHARVRVILDAGTIGETTFVRHP